MERNAAVAADKLIQLDENTDLRPARFEDAEELFAAIDRNRDRLHHWLPWATPAYSMDDSRRFLSECMDGLSDGKSLTMTIRRQGVLCGVIGLHAIDCANGNTSIGYWIDGAYEGKGIATAACRAIVTEGFRSFGLHRIEIRCATWNHRSSAIPLRLGFVEEGILREAQRLHDRWVDLRVFSMLAQDWKPV